MRTGSTGSASTTQADRALRRGHVYAIVNLTGTPTVRYAGAQGPTVFAALVRDVVPSVAAVTRSSPALVDALPLGGDDAAALPLFYICFAVVLSSYLFSITTTTQARRLRAWGHWTSAAALAVSLGLVAALVARFGTHTISAHTATVALVLMLTSLATGATSYLLLRLSSTFGSILGTVVLVILGSASGGVVPGQFLPHWLAALRPVLPMGVSLTTIRDTVYFGGHHLLRGIGVLVLWAVVPLAVATVLGRRRRRHAGARCGTCHARGMSSDLDPAAWSTFFAATLGAAATLAGLLFVAVSINLDRVLLNTRLLARAGETLIGLMLSLVASATLLAPQPAHASAGELLAVCVVVAVLALRVQLRHGPDRASDPWWWFAVRVATVQAVAVPGAIGCASVLLGGGGGLRWVALGLTSGFALTVYSAWVLLVEIVRQGPASGRRGASHARPGSRTGAPVRTPILEPMPPPSGKRLAWLRMLEAHTRLIELMESDLRRDCGVPLVWYDVMIKIWVAPGRRIRMAELAEQALLSRSWLTRRVVQLEQAGLVTRTERR